MMSIVRKLNEQANVAREAADTIKHLHTALYGLVAAIENGRRSIPRAKAVAYDALAKVEEE